jgi:hypothetical protein
MLFRGGFDEGDFFVGEAVELVDEGVDFTVGVVDLVLQDGSLVVSAAFKYSLRRVHCVLS